MEEYLAQPKYRGAGIRPTSSDVTDLVDSPWWGITLSEKWMSGWGHRKVEEAGRGEG